jgi:hypothetical protein
VVATLIPLPLANDISVLANQISRVYTDLGVRTVGAVGGVYVLNTASVVVSWTSKVVSREI